MKKKYDQWQVCYSWKDATGRRIYGKTVVSAATKLEAEQKFARKNPHCDVEADMATVP